MLLFHAFLLFYCLALVYFFFSIYTLDFIFDFCFISKQPNIVKNYIFTVLLFIYVVIDFFYLIFNFWGDSMKDFLEKRYLDNVSLIAYYNGYFSSRVEDYGFNDIGIDSSFKALVSKNDVNSTDIMYYSCYNECVGQLELLGSLINKVGE